jgi:hypothetical protein
MGDRNKEDIILGVIVIGVALSLIIYSFSLPIPGRWVTSPGAVPMGLSIILIGLGIGLILQARLKRPQFKGGGSSVQGVLRFFRKNRDFHRALFAIAFIFVFILSISFLQFYPASFLFTIIGIRIYSPRVKWYNTLAVAVLVVVGVFIIFSYIFGLPLKLGVFEYVLKLIIGRTYL